MTTHDLSSFSRSLARSFTIAKSSASLRMRAFRERMRRHAEQAARRDAYAEEFRRREERRRLWMR